MSEQVIFDEYNRPQRNFRTGRFLPGATPHNKGKKMESYMSADKVDRCKQQLVLGRGKPGERPACAGWNKRAVVFVDRNGVPHMIESAEKAGRMIGAPGRNVRLCCDGKRKHVHGYRFFWEDDNEWVKLIGNEQ